MGNLSCMAICHEYLGTENWFNEFEMMWCCQNFCSGATLTMNLNCLPPSLLCGLLFGNQIGTAGCLSLFCTISHFLLGFKEATTVSSLIHLWNSTWHACFTVFFRWRCHYHGAVCLLAVQAIYQLFDYSLTYFEPLLSLIHKTKDQGSSRLKFGLASW